jgi:alpha/beta superfamily hydrolase
MSSTRALTIKSADGLGLEAEVDLTENARAALVVCHAHPQMQGTMNSPLLLAVRDALVDLDWSVLRFNYRGVGNSEGEFGDGVAEVDDAIGAVQHIRDEQRDAPIAILGWSFGAAVALRAAGREPEIEACVAVAPSIVATPGISQGTPPPGELGLEIPILVVCGTNDEVTPPAHARKWSEDAGALYEEIGAANHFFWAKYDPLVGAVQRFLEDAI